jgi:hypothetical protein
MVGQIHMQEEWNTLEIDICDKAYGQNVDHRNWGVK